MVGLAALSMLTPGCATEFDTSRDLPKRGTAGEEMYGVLCDRIGAQSLREDLTGASFKDLCHKPTGGDYAAHVDESKLPEIDPEAVDIDGKPVSVDKQQNDRKKAVAKVEAFARRRIDLVRALDTVFPATKVGVKDLDNEDETKSCNAPQKNSEALFTDELARMLGRMGDLYNDGTLPQSTESLSKVVDTFQKSDEAQSAWARLSARNGYRPIDTALGAARPVIAYPHLRDLANASLRLLSADSQPYELDPKYDDLGRIPIPGPGNAALNKLLEAGHEEMLSSKADPALAPLVVVADDTVGRSIISRPRDNLEMFQSILYASDDAFGSSNTPRYIVRRDARGYAAITGGVVPAPFIDSDGDGLPDVDALGRFKTSDNSVAPSPFPYPNSVNGTRDEFGRASAGDRLLYEYLDTSKTFAAQMLSDMRPLVNSDVSQNHETLMDTLGGVYVALGSNRVPRTKQYDTGKTLQFDGVDIDNSPLLDLVYAAGIILGDKTSDTTLAMLQQLFGAKSDKMARLTGAIEGGFDIAQKHPEAKIPKTSTFWDETMDTMGKIAQEPGLLEDLLRALADPASANLGTVFSNYAKYKDEISYDKNNLNGPAFNVTVGAATEMKTPVDRNAPITGQNRSALYRFLSLISDTNGVTACNKPEAVVHAKLGGISVTMPVFGTYKECEVFKIENLAAFYLDSIAFASQYEPDSKPNKRGSFYLRNDTLRNGILTIGAATVGLMEDSSTIKGFWTDSGSKNLAAKPEWLNRLVFFDLQNDNVNTTAKNFIADLQGVHMGTSICPERIIDDPNTGAPDASKDGKVHGLRNCAEGDWLDQRGKNTIFTWENFGFYDAIRPVLGAFVKHGREDLFLEISTAAYKHFGGADATASECKVGTGGQCSRAGMNSYEPLITEAFATDILPALVDFTKMLDTLAVVRCDAYGADGKCSKPVNVSAIEVAAAAARSALDPNYAKTTLQLTDRRGAATAKRNDGGSTPQVTPALLITQSLSAIDDSFDAWEAAHPDDLDRRKNWRRARSQLVDQFLGVQGAVATAQFTNPTITKMTPTILGLLRSQLVAHCPKSFVPPYEACTWAKQELLSKAKDSLGGPLASTGLEMMDAIRRDKDGRVEMEKLLEYLLDSASKNDALASMLASTDDLVQLLKDDQNMVPLMHVMASAMDASQRDANGRIIQKSLVDANMALLARLSGKYFDKDGKEICRREIDPNQLLNQALANLVTPINDGDFKGQTPLEVIIDVIADVNRADPTQTYSGTLAKEDYSFVSANIVDFLSNKERGLEQFYEVIRQGTRF